MESPPPKTKEGKKEKRVVEKETKIIREKPNVIVKESKAKDETKIVYVEKDSNPRQKEKKVTK